MNSASAAFSERTAAHQLLSSCSQADQAEQDLQARDQDIRVLQDCLEAERKDKEGLQQTLADVLKLHNDIHGHLVEVCQHRKGVFHGSAHCVSHMHKECSLLYFVIALR